MSLQAHGGKLVNTYRPDKDVSTIAKEIELDAIALSDLELIGIGAYSPLSGFLNQADYESVVEKMRLANGLVWSIPITLPVNPSVAATLQQGEQVKLVHNGEVYGTLTVGDIYESNKQQEAKNVYGTEDLAHPGVAKLFERPATYVGGEVTLIKKSLKPFPAYTFEPAETREIFAEKGWKTIVGFQTRNPVHRAHEYIQKVALKHLKIFL